MPRHPPHRAPPERVRGRGERGAATTLTAALLTPVFVILMFAAVQAALWGHARTSARVAAKDAAAHVARFDASIDAASAAAHSRLANGDLRDIDVAVVDNGDVVVVTITANAPGIIIGTSRPVTVTEAVPVEELTP